MDITAQPSSPGRGAGVVLLNSSSGDSRGARELEQIKLLADFHGDVLIQPRSAQAMRQAARQAVLDGAAVVIAAGGDDTVRAALFGMEEAGYFHDLALRQRTTFGILPLGTFNNFAVAVGVPLDLEQAMDAAHHGETRWIDLGRAGSTLFTESVGVGIDVAAWKQFPRENPNLMVRIWDGAMAVVRALIIFRPHKYRIVADGLTRKKRAYNITIANTERFSAGMSVAPQAVIDDGLLDLCVIPAMSRIGFLLSVPLIFLGKHIEYLKGVQYSQVREVTLSASHRYSARVDSQIKQKLPITVRVLPNILPMRLPAKT